MNTTNSDDATVGNRSWLRADYQLINAALTRLVHEIGKWNDLATRHGASQAPYVDEHADLLRMIEWGNEQLQNQGAYEIEVRGISVGSLRYIKAALVLETWRVDKQSDSSAELAGAPAAVRNAVSQRLSRYRSLVDEITFEPAAILDEFRQEHSTTAATASNEIRWDAFVSHASNDKASFVDELVRALEAEGLRIWYDTSELSLGDSLRQSIDRGLAHSKFGVVVLSHAFFSKEWPRRELDGLAAREVDGIKVVLPIWHNLTEPDVRRYSPMLADRVGVPTSKGLQHVIREIVKAVRQRA